MSTQKTETQNIQVEQLPEQATNNNAKKQNSLENGLAVAALFFTLGIVMHFFGTATNTMALDGLYQFLAGGSFIIGFMGALIELSNYSKKYYTSLALGIVFGAIAYGI
ncbi:MAG TPA: hypothetical protein VFV38_46945, partial [Ktedonobacteraceae bacterium]|nr:hypothetical protein [Ktedonobacteraceae bacterium]